MSAGSEDDRYLRGVEAMNDLQGERVASRIRDFLRNASPEFERYAVSASYGDVYGRPGLSIRDRQLVTIGVLAGIGGCEPQLERHLITALDQGISADELIEVCIQVGAYAGQPRANNAFRVAVEVFERRGVHPGGAEPASG